MGSLRIRVVTKAKKMMLTKISPDIKPSTLRAAEQASANLRVTLISMMEPGFYGELVLKVSIRNGDITQFDVDRKQSHKIGTDGK